MERLYNSRGQHIANVVNGHRHSPSGTSIGHCRRNHGIFIDMHGHYLGEIVHGNRRFYNRPSPYRGINDGSYGNYGNVGNSGNPGNIGAVGMPSGYEDVAYSNLTR